ncbi:MAG: type IV toxin-antitoxin system AbiEi family antitoxin domain-containing protein, partial [bacterium]|nr:type IV toxin-antitoxin system AbiEi family antitoxin domain-containing protein [bacterium]
LRGERLPKWFREYDWGTKIIYSPTKLFSEPIPESFTEYTHKEFSILVSSPERAAIEMMYQIPKQQGFDEASHIMENLAMLRPQLVQKLLELCPLIKAKRLFLYFAERYNHDWLSQLNTTKIDLGAGKRMIVKNGKLDSFE